MSTCGTYPVKNFSKIKCPYVRKKVSLRKYLITPQLQDGFDWVFDDGVRAVDKLHGTNACVVVDDCGEIHAIDNREQRVVKGGAWGKTRKGWLFLEGICHAQTRGWLDNLTPGYHYGELIGPMLNKNIHELDYHLFVPFELLHERCHWHSWVKNKYPKDLDTISEWFTELPSLFSSRYVKKDTIAEGLIFYHPDGRVCKIRRDMFSWYYE